MSNQSDHRQFLPDVEINQDRIVIDVPATPPVPYQVDSIPNGYDPMGRIYLEGRGNRRLASGKIPWWVLITGWFVVGLTTFVVVIPLLPMAIMEAIFLAVVALLPLSILWRGTRAKLLAQRNRSDD